VEWPSVADPDTKSGPFSIPGIWNHFSVLRIYESSGMSNSLLLFRRCGKCNSQDLLVWEEHAASSRKFKNNMKAWFKGSLRFSASGFFHLYRIGQTFFNPPPPPASYFFYLKGPCHEIFDLWFFSSNNSIWAPDTRVKAFCIWLRIRGDIQLSNQLFWWLAGSMTPLTTSDS
jgi:hypothetical protein